MKLIIGIGNPGEKYKDNRHNVGFMVLDALVRQMANGQWSMVKKFQSLIINHESSIIFVKPQTMMNLSGKAVKKLITHYSLPTPNLWVIHDDLDLQIGNYKIQKGKGPREHKGLLSIYEALRTKDFWHVRVGVDNRNPDNRIEGEEYVLQDFTDKELAVVEQVIAKIVKDLVNRLD
jgi:PTH1 family peptidyl-tRNA hydrolase